MRLERQLSRTTSILDPLQASPATGVQDTWSLHAKIKKCCLATVGPILVCILLTHALDHASASDRSDARLLKLQRDLRSVRSRVERAPRASSLDLEDLQRRLHDLRLENARDPRVQEFEIELRRLRAKADRNAQRPDAAMLPRTSPLADPVPIEKPRYLGGGHTPAAATPNRSYFGGRLVVLQRTVAAIERDLELGDTAAAARLLEAARSELATLRRVFEAAIANDPNLIALEDRIRALEERLAPR